MAEPSYHYLPKGKIKKYNFDEEQDSTQRKTLLNVHSFCGGKCSVYLHKFSRPKTSFQSFV